MEPGKTTLVELICQTKKPTSGEINYYFDDDKIKEHIGVQFQEGTWPLGLSAYDIIDFYKGIYPHIKEDKIKQLVEIFDLKKFYKKSLNKLSGGQRQRFNALLAVIHNPDLIILDEVTTGLDIQMRNNILKFLKQQAIEKEKTIILVSHNSDEIEYLCQRVILLHNGSILIDLTIQQVFEKYQSVAKMMHAYFEGGLS